MPTLSPLPRGSLPMSTFAVRLLGLLTLFLGAGLVLLVGSQPEVSGRVGGIPSPATTFWAGALVDPREEEAKGTGIPAPGQPPPLPETLPALARQAIAHYFATGQVLPAPEEIPPHWRRPAGVFVTVTREGRPRGCWGSLDPGGEDLARATIRAAVGAVTRDWRYPPLRPGELESASIQVAIVRRVVPIPSLEQVDPTRMGLFIRTGTRGAVLLPGEALTTEWQLSTAKRLAGIPADQPVELFRVEAELLHEF
ncbi:AMMECR1 domain-containing protein [Synechococcus sp. H55.7]|uniref:AMMECR1 domain-containing protein n=2 Tax=Synechococcus TaxID=1129 RepID=UPI0039C24325